MNAKTLIEALSLWEATGSAVAQTAREASTVLSRNGIPNLIAGGIAVQLHGYPRFTNDVDLIVPDVQAAHQMLVSKGFAPSLVRMLAIVHPTLRVMVDLLPAGACLQAVCRVPFPQPVDVHAVMLPVTVEELVSLKLDSWKHNQARRLRDRSDVTELIIRASLPRNLAVAEVVREDYLKLWDDIAAEPEGPPA